MFLSKSDFILASSCAKKLVYKKAGYPTANDTNEYMEFLAKGGYVVGLYAQLLYPDGVEVKGGSPEETAEVTRRLLAENENITLFEASFSSEEKIVRTDILEKKGNNLHIIEVKSKSWDSEDEEAPSPSKFRKYILDLAYQTYVVKEAYPDYKIHSSLLLPDKSKRSNIEGLAGWFLHEESNKPTIELEELPAQSKPRFNKPEVKFVFQDDPEFQSRIGSLAEYPLLSLRPSDKEVQELMPEVITQSQLFLRILRDGISADDYKLTKACRDCEFRLGPETTNNGYRDCWSDLADIDPHIFDLNNGGHLKSDIHGTYLDELITKRTVSFSDLDPERFKLKSGDYGPRGERQLMQYEYMRSGQEFVSPSLKDDLNRLQYPLHFIDFEAYISAMPHHQGMRPYEKIAFQWSCHTIPYERGDIIHKEYINDDYSFPNFRFAESLKDHLGDSGTPLMWSNYENTTLRAVLNQIDLFGYENSSLKEWLFNITSDKKAKRSGRFIDLHALCLKSYFHPLMRGRTSIKKVLPAIWSNNAWLHDDPWFKDYKPGYEDSLDPYDTLVKQMTDLEEHEVVEDGTGAMRAYHDMMYGPSSKDPQKRAYLKQSLLNYCKLDTMSMVIIWKYWNSKQ